MKDTITISRKDYEELCDIKKRVEEVGAKLELAGSVDTEDEKEVIETLINEIDDYYHCMEFNELADVVDVPCEIETTEMIVSIPVQVLWELTGTLECPTLAYTVTDSAYPSQLRDEIKHSDDAQNELTNIECDKVAEIQSKLEEVIRARVETVLCELDIEPSEDLILAFINEQVQTYADFLEWIED